MCGEFLFELNTGRLDPIVTLPNIVPLCVGLATAVLAVDFWGRAYICAVTEQETLRADKTALRILFAKGSAMNLPARVIDLLCGGVIV